MRKKKTTKKTKTSKTSKADPQFVLNSQVWPVERDILFRPDRLKYVRKLIQTEGCVFCSAQDQVGFKNLCLYQTKYSAVVLNKFPYNTGHLLIIPRRHVGDLLDLSAQESHDIHECLRLSVEALKKVYKPGGFNIGMNLGAVAGAGIPDHLHYHIVPRWAGDLNFFPLIAETKTVIESLEQSFERLIPYFKSIQGQRNV